MSAYDRQIKQAQRVISRKGQAVTWRKKLVIVDGAEPWKETKPVAPADDHNDFPVSIVFLRPGRVPAFLSLIVGTDVPQASVRGIMPAVSFVPDLKDTVIRDQVELSIKSMNVIAPNGDPILYDIEFN